MPRARPRTDGDRLSSRLLRSSMTNSCGQGRDNRIMSHGITMLTKTIGKTTSAPADGCWKPPQRCRANLADWASGGLSGLFTHPDASQAKVQSGSLGPCTEDSFLGLLWIIIRFPHQGWVPDVCICTKVIYVNQVHISSPHSLQGRTRGAVNGQTCLTNILKNRWRVVGSSTSTFVSFPEILVWAAAALEDGGHRVNAPNAGKRRNAEIQPFNPRLLRRTCLQITSVLFHLVATHQETSPCSVDLTAMS